MLPLFLKFSLYLAKKVALILHSLIVKVFLSISTTELEEMELAKLEFALLEVTVLLLEDLTAFTLE
jgi:hypothetical protein